MLTQLAHRVRRLTQGMAAWLVLVAAALCLSACDPRAAARCAFTDIRADLLSPKALVRGLAAECALAQSAQAKAALVPEMLAHLGNDTEYRSYYSGGGVSFGEAGTRTLSVGQIAMRVVQTAQPVEANIAPIVRTLVASANAMRSSKSSGLYGDPGTTARTLTELLKYDFHRAGLGAAVASVLSRELPALKNPVLELQSDLLQDLQSLAQGVVLDPYAAQAPRAASQALSTAAAPAQSIGRRGLSWGQVSAGASDQFHASCHGEPKSPMDSLHNGSCNPYSGDTLCSAALPVLCLSPALRTLAITAPTPGQELSSRATADKVCHAAFGTDWRMASHHDAGGWEIKANGAAPVPPTRFWVAINDQPGNCWSR